MSKLTISIIQSSLHWENIDANLNLFSEKLNQINRTDLIILPEMFTTGFSMNAEQLAESMDGKTMQWLSTQAANMQAVITGSFIAKENDHYYNRLIWMRPDGTFETYDKRHLFTLAKEHETYTQGTKKLIVEYKGWKICPLICYDLRFPAWSRNVEDYDLLFYMANWPKPRNHHWKTLLMARAIENQSYTVGVNCVGKDGKDFEYSGDSSVIDYTGNLLYQVSDAEDVFTITLDKSKQQAFREKLNFLPDRDSFEIKQ